MGIAIAAGGGRMNAPSAGILGSTLAVGSSVYLMENGVAAEYLIVHQGLPSTMYDASCDGMWLLRKDCPEIRAWDSTNNDYKNSDIHAYLNGDFFNLLGTKEQKAIKQVKIPYVNGTGSADAASGANGLSTKIFLLSAHEVALTSNFGIAIQTDGEKLDYFEDSVYSKRYANYDNDTVNWWLRTVLSNSTYNVAMVTSDGDNGYDDCSYSQGFRPALILPSNARFDEETLILKGVA